MSKEVQYGSIPQNLLDDISEMSYGGYVLFSFDEKAKPQVHCGISDDLNAMSLPVSYTHLTLPTIYSV